MTPDDLFPICADKMCPRIGQHKHISPPQQDFLDATEKYVYMQGGYGSGKSIIACIKGILLSISLPGNRGVVIRESYPKLHDSTQRTFMECLDRAGIRYKGRENRDGWYHRIIIPVKGGSSEVFFRETKQLGRFLGSEFGWWLVDEALEVDKDVFKKLQGRLRLPAARGFYSGMLISNPPHLNHWLHEVFGENPRSFSVEVDISGQIELSTFRYMQVSTRQNPHNPPGYLADLLTGLTQAEIDRLVEGQYGYIPDGPPVYPMFEHHRHVGLPQLPEHVPLVRAWDFGFRHPAVSFHAFWRCRKEEIHWNILDAMDSRMVEAVPFAESVIRYTTQVWPQLDTIMVEDDGDIAGSHVSDTGPGPINILAGAPWNLNFSYKKCDVEPGVRMIRDFLKLPECKCGQSRFLVHRKVRHVIEAFQGGYHMRRAVAGKGVKEEPVKDGFYDDFMDSVRYATEHHLRSELIDPKLIDALDKTDPRRMYRHLRGDPWQRAMRKLMQEHTTRGV